MWIWTWHHDIIIKKGRVIWYKEVFEKGWKVFPGYVDEQTKDVHPPMQHHTPITIDKREVDYIKIRGKNLRHRKGILSPNTLII